MTLSHNETLPAIAPSPQSLRLEVVSERAAFDALERHWNALFDRCAGTPQVFQSFNWAWHWRNIFHDGKSALAIVAGWEGDRLVMLWPLVATKLGFLKHLTWLGEPVSQYGDVLVEQRDDVWRMIGLGWHYVQSLGYDIATLRKVRADALVAPLLFDVRAEVVVREVAPYLDFAGVPDFATYDQRHKSRSLSKRRQSMRRLTQNFANVRIQKHPLGTDAQDVIRVAMRQKRDWLREFSLTSSDFADRRFEEFFIATAQGDRVPGTSVMSLSCDDKIVATMISFGAGSRLGQHINSYALDFSKFGVGKLLQEACNRQAFEEGFQVYDLLTPGADYKLYWADAQSDVLTFVVPLSSTGKMYSKLWTSGVRPILKAARARATAFSAPAKRPEPVRKND